MKAKNINNKPAAKAPASFTPSVTFVIDGMMEYILTVAVGQTHYRVEFTGGSLSGYGVRPATFATSDAVLQSLIMQTEAYRSGKIRKLNRRGGGR